MGGKSEIQMSKSETNSKADNFRNTKQKWDFSDLLFMI